MLQRMFCMEIAMVNNWTSWLLVALLGLSIGCLFRLKAKRDIKDNFVAILIMWTLTHAISFVNAPSGYGMMPVLSLSVIAMLSPVTTFMLIGFVLTHVVVKITGDKL